MRIVILFFFVFHFSGCVQLTNPLSICDPAVRSTKIPFQKYAVYVQNPDSAEQPTIWEGPICVESKSYQQPCFFNESLIKSVKVLENSKKLRVETFSGSQSQAWELDLAVCEVKEITND